MHPRILLHPRTLPGGTRHCVPPIPSEPPSPHRELGSVWEYPLEELSTEWRHSGWAEQSCRLRPTATYMGDPALLKPGDQPHHWVFCPSAPQFPQESPQLMKWCSRLEEALPRHPSPAAAGSRAVQMTDAAPMARQAEPGGVPGIWVEAGG